MQSVPDPQKSTVAQSAALAWTTFRRSVPSSRMSCPNARSRGQMSGTICAILTVSVVVAGPGLRRMLRWMFMIYSRYIKQLKTNGVFQYPSISMAGYSILRLCERAKSAKKLRR